MPLPAIGVVPGYTFFEWGFTVSHSQFDEYRRYLFDGEKVVIHARLHYMGGVYSAKIRIAEVGMKTDSTFSGAVIQFFWDKNEETKRALRETPQFPIIPRTRNDLIIGRF